jgi:CRP/FNR family transcriptional regulator, cyclic AMP receptor protein
MSHDPEQQLKHIKSLPLFNELEEKDLITMLQNQIIRMMSFDAGEIIITEKNHDRRIFLMLKGSVKISREIFTDDCRHGQEINTIEGHGQCLGEVTAFTGKPRTASVTAISPTVCVMINVGLMINTASQLLERVKATFYPKLFELLCKRLDDTNEQLVSYKQKSEDLEKKIKEITLAKIASQKEFQDDLRQKTSKIKTMEDKIDELMEKG